MMSVQRIDLNRLDKARVAPDGTGVSFQVVGSDGEALEITCDHSDLLPLIGYMIGLGQAAAARRGEVTPQAFGDTDRVTIEPIQTSDIGLMRELGSDELVLVARMFGFDLSFTVTRDQLAALHEEIERALPKSMLVKTDHHHHHDHENDHDRQ